MKAQYALKSTGSLKKVEYVFLKGFSLIEKKIILLEIFCEISGLSLEKRRELFKEGLKSLPNPGSGTNRRGGIYIILGLKFFFIIGYSKRRKEYKN